MTETTTKLFHSRSAFTFQSGDQLPEMTIAYETYGRLNENRDNAILVCHALTGHANAAGVAHYSDEVLQQAPMLRAVANGKPGWWDAMIGPGRPFDTDRYFVISSNILGSCYGSSGPMTVDGDGQPYRLRFPAVTVRDMVAAQALLLDHLGIDTLLSAGGGSLGGMQALEWALMFPDRIRSIIPIATSARHSAWSIGLNHIARDAIKNDPQWENGNYAHQPERGLQLARKVGMMSYRTDVDFNKKFGRERIGKNGQLSEYDNLFQVESYLNYQGKKLVQRFDANSFLYLSYAMDWHDVGAGRGGLSSALRAIEIPALCIGIDSDLLYPAHEQREIAGYIKNARYAEITSPYGHDAFLIEFEQMQEMVSPFLKEIS